MTGHRDDYFSGESRAILLGAARGLHSVGMKVFVTGAAGFVGSRLARRLLDRGDAVVGFDNMNDYYALEHKERHLRDLLPEKKFTFVKGDLSEAERLRGLMGEH